MKFENKTTAKYRELADNIKDNLEVEGNMIKDKEDHGAYYSNLPEGLTKETINEVSKYNSSFVTASHLAVTEMAADVFNDTNNTEVVAEVGFFGPKDHLTFDIKKSKEYKVQLDKTQPPKEITKYMDVKATAHVESSKGYGVKSLKKAISEEFGSRFK